MPNMNYFKLKFMAKRKKTDGLREYKKHQIEEVGKKIRDLRNDLGYTQTQLAQLASETPFGITVSQAQIGNIEAGDGKNLPSLLFTFETNFSRYWLKKKQLHFLELN